MKQIKKFKWWLVSLGVIALIALTLFLPLPYYVTFPGGAYDIASVLYVEDGELSEGGSYDFVAVSVAKATPALMAYAWLTPYTDIETEEETTGGEDEEVYQWLNQLYMLSSQHQAVYQALTLADKEVSIAFEGVYVMGLNENSTFKEILSIGDTVTGINGKTFESSSELIDYVAGLELGGDVTVQYRHDDEELEAEGQIITLDNGKNGIGISLVDHTEVVTDQEILFATDGIGGPSAGLMFTLSIYDQLVEEDLLKGRHVAGTGTIESDGSVGEIGGVDKKVISAAKEGATIFFVPDNELSEEELEADPDAISNADEAKQVLADLETDMEVVPVKTVQDAIDYLRSTGD